MPRFSKQLAGDVETPAPLRPAAASRPDELLRLARAAGSGNAEAAATLVMHLGGPMLTVVRKVLGPQHPDLDDVAQDGVIAFLGTLNSFRGECSVVHFAQRVALLTALSARRRMRLRRRFTEPEGQPIDELPADAGGSPLASTVARQRRELVRELLDELPDVIAEALALHFAFGYTVEEIAAATQVSSNTVWSRLRLGKRALRRKLDRHAHLSEMFEVTG